MKNWREKHKQAEAYIMHVGMKYFYGRSHVFFLSNLTISRPRGTLVCIVGQKIETMNSVFSNF